MRNIFLTLALVMGMSVVADAQLYRIEGTKSGSTVTLNVSLDNFVNEATNEFLGCVIISDANGTKTFQEYAGVKMLESKNMYVRFDDGSTLVFYHQTGGYTVTLGDYTVFCSVREVK